MIIIGVDFPPEFQQIASVDTETGEFQEKRLAHREDAETFYRALAGQKVRVGMEASGHARVRTTAGRVAVRVVDWRRGRDPEQTSAQTEDRSTRCTADSETHVEG